MKWSEELATGIEKVDEHHRMIFQMAEDFRSALDEGGGASVYETMLRSLELYVRSHFRYEERCMERLRCPAARQNREAHASFVETLAGFRRRYESAGFDPAEARRLVDTVDDWLASHICGVDIHLRECVRRS